MRVKDGDTAAWLLSLAPAEVPSLGQLDDLLMLCRFSVSVWGEALGDSADPRRP